MSIEQFKSCTLRRTEEWTPEGADFTIEFREPSGGFMIAAEKKYVKRDKDGKQITKTADNIKMGFLLISETTYIDGKKEFSGIPEVEEFFETAGATFMQEMLERSSEVCGQKKKSDDDDEESEQEKN